METNRMTQLLANLAAREAASDDIPTDRWALQPAAAPPAPLALLPTERWGTYRTLDEVKLTRREVDRIARKCAKYNLAPPTMTTHRANDEFWHILIEGLEVKTPGGWRVVASIDHKVDGMASVAPGAPEGTFDRWTGAEPKCDECGRTMRRNKTIIIRNDAGDEKQVGGKCVTVYLGMTAEVAYTLADETGDNDRILGGGSERIEAVDVQSVLAWSLAVTQTFGWRSRSRCNEEGGTATADLVADCLFGRGVDADKLRREVRNAYDAGSDKHAETMQAINEWAAGCGGSDYLSSIRAAVEREVVNVKRIGLLASAPQAFARAQAERISKQLANPNAAAKAEVPVTTERLVIAGTVLREKEVESDFGIQYKVLLETEDGYRLWGTNPKGEFVAGDRVEFTARVERSRDDATFGFFSRPTKAKVLATAE